MFRAPAMYGPSSLVGSVGVITAWFRGPNMAKKSFKPEIVLNRVDEVHI